MNHDLLARALDEFLEHGFEGATVEAITTPLRMTKRTVYSRYGDKLGLFRAALQRAVDDWVLPVEDLKALETDDLASTLLDIARLLVTRLMSPEGSRLLRISNAESHRFPELGAYMRQRGREPMLVFLGDLLRRRIAFAPGRVPDLDDLAMVYLNMIMVPARLNAWGEQLDDAAVEKLLRQRVEIFLQGALPRQA